MSRDSGRHLPPNRARMGVPHLLLVEKLAHHQARPMNSLQGRAVLSEVAQGLLAGGESIRVSSEVPSFLSCAKPESLAFYLIL